MNADNRDARIDCLGKAGPRPRDEWIC